MDEFNKSDPKYKSCCFGFHVATVAQFLVFFNVLCWFIDMAYTRNPFHLVEIPVLVLGVYAVLKEKRIPLLTYMGINIAFNIIYLIFFLMGEADAAAEHPDDDEYKYAYECASFACMIIGVIEFFIYKAFWNFARYIKDCDTAGQRARFEIA